MIRARFSPKAARDLDEIPGYIAADNPEAAARVRRNILNTAEFRNILLDVAVLRLRNWPLIPGIRAGDGAAAGDGDAGGGAA